MEKTGRKNKSIHYGIISLSLVSIFLFLFGAETLYAKGKGFTIDRIWTSDTSGNEKTSFLPGEDIQYNVDITSKEKKPISVSGKVTGVSKSGKKGKKGKKWETNLRKKRLKIGETTVSWDAVIPKNAKLNSEATIKITAAIKKMAKKGSATFSISETDSTPTPTPTPTTRSEYVAPQITIMSPLNGTTGVSKTPKIKIEYSDEGSGIDTSTFIVKIDGIDYTRLFTVSSTQAVFQVTSPFTRAHVIFASIGDKAGNRSSTSSIFTVAKPVIPIIDPPEVDDDIGIDLGDETEFLYTGTNTVQVGVGTDTIKAERVAVLRGLVKTNDGEVLSGVTISVNDHPEFGTTLTRDDGTFDMATNGGELMTINYAKEGYLTVQREVDAPWEDYVWLPETVMISSDTKASTIDFSSSDSFQVAQGSAVSDEDGTRTATLLLPQGVKAEMKLRNGKKKLFATDDNKATIRITEYTVGENGPESMPAQLPPQSAYTYAVDFSIDEAASEGAVDTEFSKPVSFYVDNFLNFPVGTVVPVGYYDMEKGEWVASDDGYVIKILGITNGMAELDTDGDGEVDNGTDIGVTDEEREKLASLYKTDQSLWRVLITHFSPWDCNWPYGPPGDATYPDQSEPGWVKQQKNPCDKQGNSTIEIQNQTLGEAVGINGTPLSLHYSSSRVPGSKAANGLNIPLSGASIPSGLKQIELEASIAGQKFTRSFEPLPNQAYEFGWDGKDAYGRKAQGTRPVTIRIGYTYQGVYSQAGRSGQSFGYSGAGRITGNRTREDVTLWQEWEGTLKNNTSGYTQNIGGWTLNINHSYSSADKIVSMGDGRRIDVKSSSSSIIGIISTMAGTGKEGYKGDGALAVAAKLSGPRGVAVGSDGSLYIADTENHCIRRVGTDGIITTVAGTGEEGYSGDNGPATEATLDSPRGIAIGSDGCLYIADTYNNCIRRVGTDGIITTVVGTGEGDYSGDGGLATEATLDWPYGVAVRSDGNMYIADTNNNCIRRVDVDGIITTFAGTGEDGYSGDGGKATEAMLDGPFGVALGPDGSLYIADANNNRIRRVKTDGTITTVAGSYESYSGDGGLAAAAKMRGPSAVVVGSDGSFYIADTDNNCIRRVAEDKIIATAAGTGEEGYSGDNGKAASAELNGPSGLAVGSDGTIYIADANNNCIRKVVPTKTTVDEIIVASEDGGEAYVFGSSGRHLRTLNTLTGAVLYQFTYDDNSRLNTVTNGDGNVTTIERDGNGNPTAIIGPFGQRTTLEMDSDGYLKTVINHAGEAVKFSYSSEGLLSSVTDPRGYTSTYTYDDVGRLKKAENPDGGFTTLERSDNQGSYEITETTAEGVVSTYKVEELSTGEQQMTNSGCCGNAVVNLIGTDGNNKITYPDGTIIESTEGPDPRFGMQAPIINNGTVTTPAGLIQTITGTHTVALSDMDDPLSIQTQTDKLTINGKTFTEVFDVSARKMTTTSPAGRVVTFTMDDQGRVIKTEMPGLAPARIDYDTNGRPTTFTVGTGTSSRVTMWSYNSDGYLDTIKNPLSQEIRYEYDQVGRVTRQILPDSNEIDFAYDANGNTISVVPPGKSTHSFSYTIFGLENTYDPPILGTVTTQTQYEYNLDRQLTRIGRPDGKTVHFDYDSKGNLDLITLPDSKTIDYTYGETSGQLSTITAFEGETLSYSYDGSLPLSVTWTGTVNGIVSQTYNNDFMVTSNNVNNASTINFKYDQDGLLTGAGDLTIKRNSQNGLIMGTTIDNVTDTRSYNSFGELSEYHVLFNNTETYSSEFIYNALGRITEKTETVGGVTHTYNYNYDQTGQLKEVEKDGSVISSYSYDSNGNRLSHITGSSTVKGDYDEQDRMITYGNNTFTYTANGELLKKTNTTTGETTSYVYDVMGNLKSVSLPDGIQIEYIVDAQGRRNGKKINGTLVQGFLYQNSLMPIVELDESNSVVSRFVYAGKGNVPDYMIKNSVTYRIIADNLGSPRLVINTATGQVVQQMDYDEFGNVTNDTNPGFQPFGFAGGIYDSDTDLVRFGARDYDAETGRWTAKDPILFGGGDTNLYGYVRNDPINLIDPDGLYSRDFYFDLFLKTIADLSSGIADTVTLGGTKKIRQLMGTDQFVDPCNEGYKIGQWIGTAYDVVFTARGVVRGLSKAGIKTFSTLGKDWHLGLETLDKRNIIHLGNQSHKVIEEGGKKVLLQQGVHLAIGATAPMKANHHIYFFQQGGYLFGLRYWAPVTLR